MAVTMSTKITEGTQSVENNTTKVTVKTTVTSSNGSYNLNDPSGTYKIYKNSTSGKLLASGSFSHDINLNTTTTIFSKPFTLTHDDDGTLDIVVVITFATGISVGTLTNTETLSLSDIARESTVTASSCDIGEATTIVINSKSDSFRHTLTYGYSKSPTKFYEIVSKTKKTTYGWTVPEEAFAKCPNAKYVNITIKCETYSGSTKIGSDTCSFKAYANKDDCKPIVSITVAEDVNPHSLALTGDSSRVVKGISTLSYAVSAEPQNEATRKSVIVKNGTQNLATYSGTFSKAISEIIKATVTDSREYSNSATKELTLVDYTALSISASIKWQTPTGGIIDVTLSGNYSDINFGAVQNTLKLQYKCIPKSLYDSDSSNLTNASYVDIPVEPTVENGKFTVSFSIETLTSSNELFDYREAYSFRFRAIDAVFDNTDGYSPKGVTKQISAALPIFDWGKNDFNFNVPVYYNKDLSLTGAIKALTYGYELNCSTIGGSGWTINSFNATLVGGNLRCYFNATRSSATDSGNINNEEILTATITHNGKVRVLYNTSFNNGSIGTVATLYTTDNIVNDSDLSFKIVLAATGGTLSQLNGFVTLPVSINTKAY